VAVRGAARGVLSELLTRGRPLRLLLVRRFRASRADPPAPPTRSRREACRRRPCRCRRARPAALSAALLLRLVHDLRVRLPIRVAALQRADCSQSSMMQPSGSWNESAWSMPVSGSFHDRIVSCCRWSTSSLCTLALTKLLPSASLIKHDVYAVSTSCARSKWVTPACEARHWSVAKQGERHAR
jgi:hypothetical protein